MKLSLKTTAAVTAILLVTGCTAIPIDRYHVTADNQTRLKEFDVQMDVGQFTADKSEKAILCRFANNVEMSDGITIHEYLESALIEELKMAGIYREGANIVINGHLNKVDVSSGLSDAHWTFDVSISNAKGQSFNVTHSRKYSANFLGGIACQHDMPKSFLPTIQELIGKILNHSQFDSTFQK